MTVSEIFVGRLKSPQDLNEETISKVASVMRTVPGHLKTVYGLSSEEPNLLYVFTGEICHYKISSKPNHLTDPSGRSILDAPTIFVLRLEGRTELPSLSFELR
jgi:hypothetical protein